MEKINGNVAIVLLLNDLIKNKVNELSSVYNDNKILFEGQEGKCIPHITLFQTNVKNLEQKYVIELLNNIVLKLPIEVSLNKINSFGGHFVFWHVGKNKELIYLHKQALLISKFFNSESKRQVASEKLTLSEKQIQNVRKFGYPFTEEEWSPHITLAYKQNFPKIKQESEKFTTQIKKVAIVEVSEFGTIKKIFEFKSS